MASQLHGAGTVPNDRLTPKNIAAIIDPTPSAKSVWQTTPYVRATAARRVGEVCGELDMTQVWQSRPQASQARPWP